MSTVRPPAPQHQPASAQTFDAALQAERDALRLLFPLPPPHSAPAPARRLHAAGRTGLVLAAASALLLWWNPAWHTERHSTAIGEHRTVALADGSQLTLDTASAVRMAWHLRSREVDLLQGRVRFDVAHDRLRPFEVRAGQVQVRVLGTVFDVQRRHDGVRVTVLRGLVQVRDGGAVPQHWLLQPGERLQTGRSAQPEAAQADDAWTQGRLVFDRTPLRDALAELQRYRSTPIRLYDDGRFGQRTVSGVFETARTDQLLDLLPDILGAKVQRQPDGSVNISR